MANNSLRSHGWARTRYYPWIVVGLLWFCGFFNYADRQAVYSVFPVAQERVRAEQDAARTAGLGVHGRVCR